MQGGRTRQSGRGQEVRGLDRPGVDARRATPGQAPAGSNAVEQVRPAVHGIHVERSGFTHRHHEPPSASGDAGGVRFATGVPRLLIAVFKLPEKAVMAVAITTAMIPTRMAYSRADTACESPRKPLLRRRASVSAPTRDKASITSPL